MWFEDLFGFREVGWEATQARFALADGGVTLVSRANGRRFAIGRFSTPALGELREGARRVGRPGVARVFHEAIGDVLELHALPDNRGAMFQVASQLNCLEFSGPDVVPEHGVTGYAHDPTQGPACSLAAAAATVFRNYFADVDGEVGQRAHRQIDNLRDLSSLLGAPGQYFTVRNGYTESTAAKLAALAPVIAAQRRDDLLRAVRIGVHAGVGVTFARRWAEPAVPTHVSQAFCSAISCGYADLGTAAWQPLATAVLDAAYEATLWAAILDAAAGTGSGRVWLTFVGGGVFGNPRAWIIDAIRRALAQVDGFDLDVRIAHYRDLDPSVVRAVY